MVALCNFEDTYGPNPRTLGDWVKNFRLKKLQMKRKLRTSGGELRVCAILSTALMSAELELRRKQQERFQKWLDFQAKIKNNQLRSSGSETLSHQNTQDNELVLLARDDDSNFTERSKQSEEINNLWKCELSDLDNFMRSISSTSSRSSSNETSIISRGVCGRHSFSHCLTSAQQSVQVTS